MDITTIVFVLGMVVVGLFLIATIRRDFVIRQQFRRDIQRQFEHARGRRRPTPRH